MATQTLEQQEGTVKAPLLDSDIVIWVLRSDEPMVQFFEQLVEQAKQSPAVSVVTVYEVLAGMRPQEEQETRKFLDRLIRLPVTEEIAEKAAEYYREFRAKGQTLHITDLLIAATSFCHNLPLATLNRDDFPMTDITFWQEVPSPPPDGKPRRTMTY